MSRVPPVWLQWRLFDSRNPWKQRGQQSHSHTTFRVPHPAMSLVHPNYSTATGLGKPILARQRCHCIFVSLQTNVNSVTNIGGTEFSIYACKGRVPEIGLQHLICGQQAFSTQKTSKIPFRSGSMTPFKKEDSSFDAYGLETSQTSQI